MRVNIITSYTAVLLGILLTWVYHTKILDLSTPAINLSSKFADQEECPAFNPSLCLRPWVSRSEAPEEWLTYLASVYGPKGVQFPFDPSSLKFFYGDRVPFRDHAHVVKFRDRQKVPFGHLFECGWKGETSNIWCVHAFGSRGPEGTMKIGSYLNESASKQKTPYGQMSTGYWYVPRVSNHELITTEGFREGQFVEVTHECCDDFVESEGMWFFYTPGSGVYLQLGRILIFKNKPELCSYVGKFTNTSFDCSICCAPLYQYLVPHLRRMGIDTLLFTDSVPGGHVSVLEIWEVRETKAQKHPSPCAPVHEDSLECEDCTARFLFRGWKGSEPCICDESNLLLQCVPHSELLTTVFTGDMHGYVDGVPILSEFLNHRRKVNPTLLLSTGDAFLGSPFFQQNGPIALGEMYMPLQYDAMGLGNHDLEFHDNISAFASKSGSPLVCFNLRHLSGVVPWVHLLPASHLRACATGFTKLDHGVVNETMLEYASPGGTLFWSELHAVLTEMYHEGCNLIFILGHAGLKLDREVAEKTPSSVVVLGGHDHDIAYEDSYLHPGRVVMHAGALFREAGVLELYLTTDPRSQVKMITEAHSTIIPLVDETSRLEGNDGPTLLEISSPQDRPPFHSRDCRSGRCPLGDMVAELMFLAAVCGGNATGVVGALREAGSIRSSTGHKVTESGLRNVLLWNNDLVVVELQGHDIISMLLRSNESIAEDGGGAALSLFGVRALGGNNEVEVLTEASVQDHFQWWCRSSRRGSPVVRIGHGSKDGPVQSFRQLGQNETVRVTVTNWLWQGGDGFDIPGGPPFQTIGPEVDVIVALLTTSSGTGILGAALGAIARGLTAALVYGCSRTQTRAIVSGKNHPRFNLMHIAPCTCQPGCFVTVVAVGIGHFLFWGILRSLLSSGICGTMLASLIAAFTVAVVENPLWVVVTRAQARDYNTSGQKMLNPRGNGWLIVEYWHFTEIVSTIWSTKGLMGFCAGLFPNLILMLHPILQANLYFVCVQALVHLINPDAVDVIDEDILGTIPWLSVVAGIASTASAMVITYPLQVIRIRLQMGQFPFSGRYYDGIGIKGLQALFSSSVTFFFMDYISYHLRSFNPDKIFSSLNSNLAD